MGRGEKKKEKKVTVAHLGCRSVHSASNHKPTGKVQLSTALHCTALH